MCSSYLFINMYTCGFICKLGVLYTCDSDVCVACWMAWWKAERVIRARSESTAYTNTPNAPRAFSYNRVRMLVVVMTVICKIRLLICSDIKWLNKQPVTGGRGGMSLDGICANALFHIRRIDAWTQSINYVCTHYWCCEHNYGNVIR